MADSSAWRVVAPDRRALYRRATGGGPGGVSWRVQGPAADLFGLVGEVLGTEVVPIDHRVSGEAGQLHVPGLIEADMEPFRGPDRSVTTLRDSLFSTVPGSPAWVGKASVYRVELPAYASPGTTRAVTGSRRIGTWSTGDDRSRPESAGGRARCW